MRVRRFGVGVMAIILCFCLMEKSYAYWTEQLTMNGKATISAQIIVNNDIKSELSVDQQSNTEVKSDDKDNVNLTTPTVPLKKELVSGTE